VDRLDPLCADRLLGRLQDERRSLDVRAHVPVLSVSFRSARTRGLRGGHLVDHPPQERDLRFEQLLVELSEDQPISACFGVPVIEYGWMKPSRPEVVSGVSRFDRKAATI